MKKNKDIGQNIKDNQHKLDKQPSKNAWNKLEGQLDDFKPKAKRRKLIAKWSIAASILAIIGIGSVVSNSLNSTENNQTAMNAPVEMTFEELSHVEISKSTKLITESYRQAQKKVKIVEGTDTKKLVPSPEVVKFAEVVNTEIKPEIIAPVQEEIIATTTIEDAKTIESEQNISANADVSGSTNKIIEEKTTEVVKETAKIASAKRTVRAKVKKAEKPAPKPAKVKAKYVMSSSLNDFKWIMGNWREIASGNSAWNLTGNDILQNEDLKISLVGDKVFLDVPFEDFAGRYTLVSQTSGHYTFVRKGVVITITKNGKGFDVTLNDHGFEQVTMRSYMK